MIVRFASFTLFKLSSIPVEDASNGFVFFLKKLSTDLILSQSWDLLIL